MAKDEQEKSTDSSMYQVLSIIKHGNPAVGHIAFSVSVKPGMFLFDEKNAAPDPKILLQLLSFQLERSFNVLISIARKNDIDLNDFDIQMNTLLDTLKDRTINNLNQLFKDRYRQMKDHR